MLRGTWVAAELEAAFGLRGSHSLRPPFPGRSARPLSAPALLPQSPAAPATPSRQRRQAVHRLGLGSALFARRYLGLRGFFLFLGLLRCFSSPGALPCPMGSGRNAWVLPQAGSPIRVSPDRRLFATPRGVSPLTAPFFGSKRQGILRVPSLA